MIKRKLTKQRRKAEVKKELLKSLVEGEECENGYLNGRTANGRS